MKTKLPTCKNCGSNEALYIKLSNGEKLPSFVMKIGNGIWCNACNQALKNEGVSK